MRWECGHSRCCANLASCSGAIVTSRGIESSSCNGSRVTEVKTRFSPEGAGFRKRCDACGQVLLMRRRRGLMHISGTSFWINKNSPELPALPPGAVLAEACERDARPQDPAAVDPARQRAAEVAGMADLKP